MFSGVVVPSRILHTRKMEEVVNEAPKRKFLVLNCRGADKKLLLQSLPATKVIRDVVAIDMSLCGLCDEDLVALEPVILLNYYDCQFLNLSGNHFGKTTEGGKLLISILDALMAHGGGSVGGQCYLDISNTCCYYNFVETLSKEQLACLIWIPDFLVDKNGWHHHFATTEKMIAHVKKTHDIYYAGGRSEDLWGGAEE